MSRAAVLGAVGAAAFVPQIVQVTTTGGVTVAIPSGATKVDIFAMGGGEPGGVASGGVSANGGAGARLGYLLGVNTTGHTAIYCDVAVSRNPGQNSRDTNVQWDTSGGTTIVQAPGGGFTGGTGIMHAGGAGGGHGGNYGGGGGGPGGTDGAGQAGTDGSSGSGSGNGGASGAMTTMQATLGLSWSAHGGDGGASSSGNDGGSPGGGGGGAGGVGNGGNGARGEVYLRFY